MREWEGAEAGLQQWEGAGLMAASGMVRPCQCGGSMACLHLTCLQRWIERRRMDGQLSEAALRCEVCLQPYRVRVEESKCCTPPPRERGTSKVRVEGRKRWVLVVKIGKNLRKRQQVVEGFERKK